MVLWINRRRGFIRNYTLEKYSSSFLFSFEMCLHKDDGEMLDFIKKTLGVGKVYTYGKVSKFCVTQQKEVKKIVEIFSYYPLNYTKHLNF